MRLTTRVFARVLMIALVSLAVPATADEAADIAALTEAFKVLDEAFADNDVDTIRAMMTEDHVAVTTYYGRAMTIDEQLAALPDFKLQQLDYADESISLLAPDIGMVMFTNRYEGTYAGEPGPAKVFVSEIWKKVDGGWKQRSYQETPVD